MAIPFSELIEARHRYAQEWQARTGRGAVGYLCSYVPEEVLYAAGLLPVRILAGHQPQDISERHIPTMYCPFSRSLLAEGLGGRYSYLKGLVLAKSCLHMHQVYDSWTHSTPSPFEHFLDVPRTGEAGALKYFVQELRRFQEAVEGWVGQGISPQALREAIGLYQAHRGLLRQVYALRQGPSLSGAEAMAVVISGMVMDKAEHLELLRRFLASPPNGLPPGPRLLVVGSANDEIEIIRLIESLGARVVADDQCFGSRSFWESEIGADPGGDPLEFLAAYYLGRPPCPTKDFSGGRRLHHILNLTRDFGVGGVVFLHQKFCHPHQYDYPYLERALRQQGLPCCVLELDTTIPLGQLRTRVEAFLEMMD